jgi:hypothetical protein
MDPKKNDKPADEKRDETETELEPLEEWDWPETPQPDLAATSFGR